MKDVLVTESIAGKGLTDLKADFEVLEEPELWQTPDRLLTRISDFKALLVRNQTQVTKELLAGPPDLQIVARAGAGLDNIDLPAADAAGIVVTYAPEQNSISVAELTLGCMLALARKITAADRSTKSGAWNRREYTGLELYDKILGLIGLGRIGYRVGLRAQAFGMKILAFDEYINPDGPFVSELRARMVGLEELLAHADFVSCHLPLTRETRGLFGRKMFGLMKPSAFFINTSRGEVVDEPALIQALEEKRIAGAALDVRQTEPPAAGPFSQMDNVILTPHIGAFTTEAQERVVSCVCRDIANVLEGRPAANYYNFPRPKREKRG